jgi:hypothetical protein
MNINGREEDAAEETKQYEYAYEVRRLRRYEYAELTIRDAWTDISSGGTPIPIRANIPGNSLSWSSNPQFLLEIDCPVCVESEILVLLSQSDPQNLHEIFICICNSPDPKNPSRPIEIFKKDYLLKDGGASYIRKSKSVSVKTNISIPSRLIIVPSTWETSVSCEFDIDCFVRTMGMRMAVKLRRIN